MHNVWAKGGGVGGGALETSSVSGISTFTVILTAATIDIAETALSSSSSCCTDPSDCDRSSSERREEHRLAQGKARQGSACNIIVIIKYRSPWLAGGGRGGGGGGQDEMRQR